MDKKLQHTAEELGEVLKARGMKVTFAESCTAGLAAMAVASAKSSADFFSRGFITYTNQAKQEVLGVSHSALETYTAVSEPVVREMAQGALRISGEQAAVSISGYAGPDGGPDGTPAGTVWFGWAFSDGLTVAEVETFSGDCEEVIVAAANFALTRLTTLLESR
ncbi:competence protein ComA [Chimaeribacter californicus]|uniref:Competence protein ComA n=1 Tax=Chimaeribacter californicus TaxID=2060067 RepID=A0A2N5EFT4_9GAMM|nr:nicotinamide-nucleotide amidohydrolase family protein [Chimaeribacter californicus]PLR41390.1 competence protein ComA [Chimaeribacter californicus]